MAYVVAAVLLSLVGFVLATTGTGSTRSPTSQADRQPPLTGTSDRATVSAAAAAGSSFKAMMARRNHSVLTAGIGRVAGGLGGALSRSYKKLVSYQPSEGVATSGASSQRVRFSWSDLGAAFVNVAGPRQPRQLP